MQEKTLTKIALITMVVGLISLYFISSEIDVTKVESLESINPAEEVRIIGEVTSVRNSEKAIFIEMSGTKKITTPVIVFADEPLYLKVGNRIEVTGLVEEYKGKKEVIASKIAIK